eukprot:TRINITY_DN74602_c0_g1_i1.p1 TRINITY_DN74602_c0_g1~~TRINITY_DN74602_c0_g1_i1.p1  ORF type:complete len:121 (-),score=18.16 TRINITY_DN74602_c0_g1_i1:27-389(-)
MTCTSDKTTPTAFGSNPTISPTQKKNMEQLVDAMKLANIVLIGMYSTDLVCQTFRKVSSGPVKSTQFMARVTMPHHIVLDGVIKDSAARQAITSMARGTCSQNLDLCLPTAYLPSSCSYL